MSEIHSHLNNYLQLSEKIKIARKNTKELLNIRRAEEEEIKLFLKTNDSNSITFNGATFSLNARARNEPISRQDLHERAVDVLRQQGISDPETVLREMRHREKIQIDTLRLA